uniref:PAS domain S-box protein n=1 Tax=Phenylobacterium glaciei TaxID=2803784 RepID=A0A974S9Y5_9CAUL|nr:PAS domain S-box protein [Phenylobacterium glaciei]
MFDPKDHEQLRLAAAGQTDGHTDQREYAITRADGRRGYVRMTGAVERDANGEPSYMYGVIIDVTQAKLREQAIAESEARYRLLADNVTDVIVRYDARGVIEFISLGSRLRLSARRDRRPADHRA